MKGNRNNGKKNRGGREEEIRLPLPNGMRAAHKAKRRKLFCVNM